MVNGIIPLGTGGIRYSKLGATKNHWFPAKLSNFDASWARHFDNTLI